MKFGKSFEQALESEDFPKEWVKASIQYKKLKKCIRKVVTELASLGLNASTLHLLVSGSEGYSSHETQIEQPAHLQYEFEGTTKHFQPKILLTFEDDLSMSAHISPETRKHIEQLLQARPPIEPERIIEIPESEDKTNSASASEVIEGNGKDDEPGIFQTDEEIAVSERKDRQDAESHENDPDDSIPRRNSLSTPRTIEIVLSADSDFFNLLTQELSSIDALQAQQKTVLTAQVNDLGKEVSALTKPSKSSHSDMYAWREIFSLYKDAAVFFASTERDHGARNAAQAQERIQWFTNQLQAQNLPRKFKNKRSKDLLNFFLNINKTLLLSLLFQEMNSKATQKILKKFDKRTSLTASSSFPEFMSSDPFFTKSLARGVCFVMSENLLSILPQLDDYICPVCSSITYRPVRLTCSHVFCIRCLVVLQRQKKSQCPLCRKEVVLQADSGNIDESLLNFLKLHFPKEVKAKQLENERLAGLDQLEKVGLGPRKRGERNEDCVIS